MWLCELVYDGGVFGQLERAIDDLDIPVDGDALVTVIALRDRLEARITDAVATVDRASLWELDGATSMTAWLADRARMARPHAAATASRARKLAQLAVTRHSWRAGVLSSGQVEAIAANLDAETAELFADHESDMVPTLVDLPARDVALVMQRWREQATADRDPKPEPPQALHHSRTLGNRWRTDGTLNAETGELLATALRLAETRDGEDEPLRSPATAGRRPGRHLPVLPRPPASPPRWPSPPPSQRRPRHRALPRRWRRPHCRRHHGRPRHDRSAAVRQRPAPCAHVRAVDHPRLRQRHPHRRRPAVQRSRRTRPALPLPRLRPSGAMVRRPPRPVLGERRAHGAAQPGPPVQPAPPPPAPRPLARQAPSRRHVRGHRPAGPGSHHSPAVGPTTAPAPARVTTVRWPIPH